MTSDKRSLLAALHEASHRVPGVPDHVNQPVGHQGDTHHGHAAHTGRRSPHRTWNHSARRPPRVLVGWQRRIAALFGQQPG